MRSGANYWKSWNSVSPPVRHVTWGASGRRPPTKTGGTLTQRFSISKFRAPLVPAAEIAEIAWVESSAVPDLPLAPLTRDHVLPLAGRLYTG